MNESETLIAFVIGKTIWDKMPLNVKRELVSAGLEILRKHVDKTQKETADLQESMERP